MLYFATTNQFKIKEAQNILNKEIEPIIIDDIPEIQEIDTDEIVKYKSIHSYNQIGYPVMVEDTGLYFNALNGFPGALIKWLLKSIGTDGTLSNGSKNDSIIRLIDKFDDKTAYAKTSIGLYNPKISQPIIIATGIIYGTISDKAIGKNGFGWDDIFIPNGYSKTFAEMTTEEKNNISMRKKALENLKKSLA
jgi:XTP/dITP diphosphohydrolase